MSDFRHFDLEDVDRVSVLTLKHQDFFDRLVIRELQDEMTEYVKNASPAKLLINFGRASAVSSETINALLRTREWILANNGQLKLCDMTDTVRTVFKVANLEPTIFEIHDSMSKALEAFD